MGAATVWEYMAHGYPRLFRRDAAVHGGGDGDCAAGIVLGVLLTVTRPAFMHLMLGPQMVDTIERHKMWTDGILGVKPMASAGIMTNNITVCFITFAGGIAAGLGTIYSMFNNGLLIGVIFTACAQHGMALDLGSFMAAHGALELPSVFISGGAGLAAGFGAVVSGDAAAEGRAGARRERGGATDRRDGPAAGGGGDAGGVSFADAGGGGVEVRGVRAAAERLGWWLAEGGRVGEGTDTGVEVCGMCRPSAPPGGLDAYDPQNMGLRLGTICKSLILIYLTCKIYKNQ